MNSQRILLVGALLLFLSSTMYGLFYDGFLQQAQQQSLLYNLDMAINMATKGDLITASAFAQQFAVENRAKDIQARIPLHLAVAGAMATAPALLLPKLDISEPLKQVLALLIVFGGAVLAFGDFIQSGGQHQLGYYVTMAGYAWIVLGLTGYFLSNLISNWLQGETRKKRG
jgi:hypothetical protein